MSQLTAHALPERVIELVGVSKTYALGEIQVHALRQVSLRIARGDYVALMGPSGSGKSTLMNILGCLDQPTAGSYLLDGGETSSLSDDQLAEVRSSKIGFVFQQFNLLPRTTAVEQVELPLLYTGARHRRQRAVAALEEVGLAERIHHRPTELSGGQQQRVAIARALVTQPTVLLADEPTGALDTHTSTEVMALFDRLNRERGITVVLVTHDSDVAHHSRRIISLRDGEISADQTL
jgi:putative ABC transport system ATP-binding protein